MLEYKCKLYGKHFVQVDSFYPSTKTCSNCSHKQQMKLSQRTFNCENCNLSIDRDHNAAMNILKNTAGIAGINACGVTTIGVRSSDLSRYVSMKQETCNSLDHK